MSLLCIHTVCGCSLLPLAIKSHPLIRHQHSSGPYVQPIDTELSFKSDMMDSFVNLVQIQRPSNDMNKLSFMSYFTVLIKKK